MDSNVVKECLRRIYQEWQYGETNLRHRIEYIYDVGSVRVEIGVVVGDTMAFFTAEEQELRQPDVIVQEIKALLAGREEGN